MPTTDTGPQPDTTPPSPAAAGKTGKRANAPAVTETLAAPAPAPAAVADVETETEAATEPAPPEPGWFRNTSETPLVVIPDRYPSTTLAPGEATWLPDDPRHPNLERCDAPAPDATAADTTGSEQ